jgi:hypothetical protein
MDFLKKNKIIVGVIIFIVVVIGAGAAYMNLGGSGGTTTPGDQTENIKQISPADIGLELSFTKNGQAIVMKVTKLDGIKSLEYEISYDSEEEIEGETQTVPDGVIGGPIEVAGESEIEREIYLGTCSATCRPDTVKSDIKVLVKVNFENGEVGEAEDTLALETEE